MPPFCLFWGNLARHGIQQNIVDNLQSMACAGDMGLRENMRETFEQRRQRPLVVEVRDELERMILGGEFPAGERLNEHQLAEQMGVSRGPVREAARSLERDGLVTTIANQGVFVKKLSIDDALELYNLRAMIAGYLCAETAAAVTPKVIADLRAYLNRMQDAISAADEPSYFALNIEFHDYIALASGTGRAHALYVALGKEVQLFRHRVLRGHASLVTSNEEHRKIVEAIESSDTEAARIAGADHHMNGKKRLLETL